MLNVNPKKYAIKESDCVLSDDDVKAIILALLAGSPEGMDEDKLLAMAEKVQKQAIKAIADYAVWELIKKGKVAIVKATDDDMIIRILSESISSGE